MEESQNYKWAYIQALDIAPYLLPLTEFVLCLPIDTAKVLATSKTASRTKVGKKPVVVFFFVTLLILNVAVIILTFNLSDCLLKIHRKRC